MRKLLTVVVAAAVVAAAVVSAAPVTAAERATEELPVTFTVVNTNTSSLPCPSDGASYLVRGHVVGPRGVLESGRPLTGTLYLYGYDTGEWNWRLPLPGYDHATEMAALGHVSITIDQLGYGTSGMPADGNLTCAGAAADVAHQVVQQLRSGTYAAAGERPRFSRVVLAGHDVGGLVAETEAASYGDVDGLVLTTWADQGQTPFIIERAVVAANDWCNEHAVTTPPDRPGYTRFATEDDWRSWIFSDADPRVVDLTDPLRNPNPCGVIRSTPTGTLLAQNTAMLARVTAPVLVVFGDDDQMLWTRQGEEQQAGKFTGSRDASTVFVPKAAHFPMFERSAPSYRAKLSSWLRSRLGDDSR